MRPDTRDGALPDTIRLRHMRDAAVEAVAFVRGKSEDDLRSDRQLLLAVMKAIEIVGEAARCVSDDTRSKLPQVPWPLVVGMRHRMVHVYFDINERVVWDTLRSDLPPLIARLEEYLRDTKPDRPTGIGAP